MANELSYKRPKVDDDDEELLRQQEKFLKMKYQPSAKVVNSQRSANIRSGTAVSHDVKRDPGKTRSHFSSLRKLGSKQEIISTSRISGEIINPTIDDKIQRTSQGQPEDVIQNIPIATSNIILGNVVEKKPHMKRFKFDNKHISMSGLSIPKVFGPDNMKTDGKRSIFWQKIATLKRTDDSIEKSQKNESLSNEQEDIDIPIDSQWAAEIHEENLRKLAQMSKEEILKEKKTLEETLDPNIIQFLKNKKRRRADKESVEQNIVQHSVFNADEAIMDMQVSSEKKIKLSSDDKNDMTMDHENDTLSIPKSSQEILQEGRQKGWVHMDIPEPEKLKWMEDLTANTKEEPDSNKWYNARFDFNGLLLPYKDEALTVDKGLHHHGEEPERPGYSLQELLQLSRSSTQQQRCMALTTLANTMEKTRKGWYDKILHPAPLTALSQKNILLLLRFSLDDTSVAVVTAALQALRAFLFSEADEVCLDRLHGFDRSIEPALMPQLEDKDTSSLKDNELAQLDAVATLLRSDFLVRIRYILNEMHPSPLGVTCALDILIRLARHSHITALNISSSPHLLDTIVHNFMPLSMDRLAMQDSVNNAYGIPLVQAVRLCRVLVTYGKQPVAEKLDNFKVIQTILTYISSETGRKDTINLSIESLRLWKMLLHYKVGLESISGAQLVLVSQLQLLLSNHNIQHTSELACEHATALIAVASCEETLKPHIATLMAKWSVQLSSVSEPTWAVMKLLTETLCVVDDISAFRMSSLSNPHIFSKLRSNSNLLSDCKLPTDREPSCLPNLGVLMENGELQTIVSLNSCVPFLAMMLTTLYNNSRVEEIQLIFEQPSFCKYMRDLDRAEWNLERSWYSRTELYFLTMVVKAASILGDKINSAMTQIIWKITIKLISALPADAIDHVKSLLKIAMSKEQINLEVVTNELAKLNLSASTDQVKIGLCSNTASLYEKYITQNGDWDQAAMPKDWLFLPLVHVYTKCKNNIKLQPEDKESIQVVLSLALILPDLMEKLSPSLRFSRLILVYLCDTLYLDKDVSSLLANIVFNLLDKYHTKLNFRIDLPGLSSFTDLFTALCEHFCSSSYGDDGFAVILLIPLAQRHDVHYRKLLWSEHVGALRYLRLSLEKLIIPLREYLYPEEEDTSLIESYITALVRGAIREDWCPVPYTIALHHSAMYLKRSSKLAVRMRMQMEKLPNKDIANKLLQYETPQL